MQARLDDLDEALCRGVSALTARVLLEEVFAEWRALALDVASAKAYARSVSLQAA